MINKLYATLILFTCVINGYTQEINSEKYYYYKGQKKHLKVNKSKFIIYHNDSAKLEDFTSSRQKVAKKIKCNKKINGAEITLFNAKDYNQEIASLRIKKMIKAIEVVVGDTISVPVSNNFYIKLKHLNDTILLRKIALETKTKILRPVANCDKWYALEVNKNAVSDCIGVSNIFFETGLFDKVDPGFIFNFSRTCRTDQRFDEQWAIDNEGVDINACDSWNITTGNNNITLAIIDQGIDNNHNEFASTNFVVSYDAQDRVSPAQLHGDHGTHVCGIISSDHDLSDIAGLAPNLNIMEISHPLTIINTISEDLAAGINWAVQNNADILSNSWGDQGGAFFNNLHSALLEDAIDNAIENGRGGLGCVVAFAAGNQSPVIDYPASYRDEIIVVGSIDNTGQRSNFSGFGNDLDIVAPGGDILSTIRNNQYAIWDGTSMATPYVSAIAGLILSLDQTLTQKQVCDIIESTAQKVGGYNYQTTTGRTNGTWHEQVGYGCVNAYEAVLAAQNTYSISGPTNLCSKGGSFSINLPSNATVTWNKSFDLEQVSPQGSNPCIFKPRMMIRELDELDRSKQVLSNPKLSISSYIEAVVTVAGNSITIRKTIKVGTPHPEFYLYNGNVRIEQGYVGNQYYFSAFGEGLSSNSNDYQWEITPPADNNNPIPITILGSGRNCSFTPSNEGLHQVKLKYNGICGWSTWLSKNFNFLPGAYFTVYPNPANSNITIELNNTGTTRSLKPYTLSIFDNAMRVKQQHMLKQKKTTLNIGSLKSGIYFIKLEADNNTSIQKLFVD